MNVFIVFNAPCARYELARACEGDGRPEEDKAIRERLWPRTLGAQSVGLLEYINVQDTGVSALRVAGIYGIAHTTILYIRYTSTCVVWDTSAIQVTLNDDRRLRRRREEEEEEEVTHGATQGELHVYL